MNFSFETQIFQSLLKALDFISFYYFITNISVTEHFYCPFKHPSHYHNVLQSDLRYAGSGTEMNRYFQLHTGLPEFPVLLFTTHFSFYNNDYCLLSNASLLFFSFL